MISSRINGKIWEKSTAHRSPGAATVARQKESAAPLERVANGASCLANRQAASELMAAEFFQMLGQSWNALTM
jgi:hypothetical protein